MLSFQYIKGRLFHYLSCLRNGRSLFYSKRYFDQELANWCGTQSIFFHPSAQNRKTIIKHYTRVIGDLDQVRLNCANQIAYDDHVSRIKVHEKMLDEAFFIRPELSSQNPIIFSLKDLPDCPPKIQTMIKNNSVLNSKPKPFDYTRLEKDLQNRPVCVGLPASFKNNFILNENNDMTENVLHMPIKISQKKSSELMNEKRVSSTGKTITHTEIYLPIQFEELRPLIEHVCHFELNCNPFFINDYYIFLTVSCSTVATGKTQRRGGWHIDGHQGHERLQKNGEKLPIDRQYLMMNELPTEVISHQFTFKKVRNYCQHHLLDLDSINMQDVIEQQASSVESPNNIQPLSCNQLYFLNPYIVHRAVPNLTGQPLQRTFVRLLCSTFPRNRLGDTINPILGPVYPMKIKTIQDIREIPKKVCML